MTVTPSTPRGVSYPEPRLVLPVSVASIFEPRNMLAVKLTSGAGEDGGVQKLLRVRAFVRFPSLIASESLAESWRRVGN